MFIKTRYLVFAVLFGLPLAASFGAPSDEPGKAPLEIRIANFRGLIGVGGKYQRHQLHVVVTNVSDEPLRIWDQWNSWGYHNLTLSLKLENGDETELQRFGGRAWSQNAPDSVELGPGEHYVLAVWLMPEDRKARTNSWGPIRIRNGDYPWATLQAHYEIESESFAESKGVWVGRISSKPIRLRMKDQTGEIVDPVR
jgi:hypothetical protein